jgi:hypothetical protein
MGWHHQIFLKRSTNHAMQCCAWQAHAIPGLPCISDCTLQHALDDCHASSCTSCGPRGAHLLFSRAGGQAKRLGKHCSRVWRADHKLLLPTCFRCSNQPGPRCACLRALVQNKSPAAQVFPAQLLRSKQSRSSAGLCKDATHSPCRNLRPTCGQRLRLRGLASCSQTCWQHRPRPLICKIQRTTPSTSATSVMLLCPMARP